MRKWNIERQKDLYRLWIEYLKRSDDYREFSEWVVKRRKNKKLSPPDMFKRDPKTGNPPKEILNYVVFGPIHDPRWTFEEWWADHKKGLTYRQAHSTPRPVEDYLKFIGNAIDSCIESFERKKGKKPTLQEFKNYFLRRLNDERYFSFLMINNSKSEEAIEAEFKKIRREWKKDPQIKWFKFQAKMRYLPSTNYVRMDELRRHLSIYDKKKEGLGVNEIIKTDEYYKERKERDDVARRLVYMDIAKAKKIIRNTEFGIFPGKYEGVKARIS